MNTLDICIDSESVNSLTSPDNEILERLLSYNNNTNTYYNFLRSSFNSSSNPVSKVPEMQYPVTQKDEQRLETIAKNALKKPVLTEGERSFLLFILNRSGLSKTGNIVDTGHNIKDKIFVTENADFLGKRFSFDRNVLSLESFLPGIRLVNLKDCIEIMDLFAKTHDMYFKSSNMNATMKKGYWYWCYFRLKLPYYNVPIPTSSLTDKNDILSAFAKRFNYLLIAVDELGKIHYFRDDDEIMTLYHFNYIISLITGIFDNLAIHTYESYKIRFPYDNIPSRISLNNAVGKDFLEQVKNANPTLRNYVANCNNFINLIYDLRERVIHAEGLKEIGVLHEFKIFPVILVNSDTEGKIRLCGDKPGPYRRISEWGVLKYVIWDGNNKSYYLEPYYFARSALIHLAWFANEFLKQMGHSDFLSTLGKNNGFFQELEAFKRYSLRVIE